MFELLSVRFISPDPTPLVGPRIGSPDLGPLVSLTDLAFELLLGVVPPAGLASGPLVGRSIGPQLRIAGPESTWVLAARSLIGSLIPARLLSWARLVLRVSSIGLVALSG
ncbi:hypothetical protein U1Q18_019721 [Sarracenia purpurea var. burkii]